jgi:hypothetical protein
VWVQRRGDLRGGEGHVYVASARARATGGVVCQMMWLRRRHPSGRAGLLPMLVSTTIRPSALPKPWKRHGNKPAHWKASGTVTSTRDTPARVHCAYAKHLHSTGTRIS